MSPNEIIVETRATPFVPFRVHLSDGSSYDVRHPEMILVTRSRISIAVEVGKDGMAARTVVCDPLHITRLDPIVNGSSGGRPRRRKRAG